MSIIKMIAAQLPSRWQSELKRIRYGIQIRIGRFVTDEPEYKILNELIGPGDLVLDIGANVGHYTKRFSELVESQGRVIAFEPVPATFSLLAANIQLFAYPNVSLVNAAISDKMSIVGMSMPISSTTGLANYYQAHLSCDNESDLSVLTMALDWLELDQPIALVKIDVEGHESMALAGMQTLIEKYHPILIVETGDSDVINSVESAGYNSERLPNSPNILFRPIC